ncbi:hypothetical protein KOW79_007738 [Hemibagrus wyckioides]|uniref:Uncharacterized protein n=1 Tax=Hemibagrus wyckioides TaxID=337641 RepID=A0A9D3NWM2_9TELE|nr:hypothetical protein KOW79_007738 [Hemibagrus wyckioides]
MADVIQQLFQLRSSSPSPDGWPLLVEMTCIISGVFFDYGAQEECIQNADSPMDATEDLSPTRALTQALRHPTPPTYKFQ